MQDIITHELVDSFIAFCSAVFIAIAGAGVRALSKWSGPAGTLLAEQAVELANARLKRGIQNELVKRGFLNADGLPPDDVDAIDIANNVARQMPDALKTVNAGVQDLANIVPGVLAGIAAQAVTTAATNAIGAVAR